MHYNQLPFLPSLKKENHQDIQPTTSWAGAADKVCTWAPVLRAVFRMYRKTKYFQSPSEVDASQTIKGHTEMENHAQLKDLFEAHS